MYIFYLQFNFPYIRSSFIVQVLQDKVLKLNDLYKQFIVPRLTTTWRAKGLTLF